MTTRRAGCPSPACSMKWTSSRRVRIFVGCESSPTCAFEQVTLSPRFAVIQGKKPDGSPKVRPIDDLTRSGCNAATETTEKLSYESLDALLTVLRALEKAVGSDLTLWKADIDSAFRRIPLLKEHRQYANIAFLHKGNVVTAEHWATPFGGVSSVHHWERAGNLIKAIARRLLHLPVLRRVSARLPFFKYTH